jgi:NNP family nitrate/nitrite transporter-like MFS transporter
MYTTLAVSAMACLVLSLPVSPVLFMVVIFVLGFFMSLGKAAVYKHIPAYYPENVGSVGGVVGMIGGLGGFILPIAFGSLKDATGLWPSCFLLLFAIAGGALLWMHLSVRSMSRSPVAALPVRATA